METAIFFCFTVSSWPVSDMEYHLAARIWDLCSCGVVVQTWMLNEEAEILLHELYLKAFPNPSNLKGDNEETFGFKSRQI